MIKRRGATWAAWWRELRHTWHWLRQPYEPLWQERHDR